MTGPPRKRRAPPGGSGAPSREFVSAARIDALKLHRRAPKTQADVNAEFDRHPPLTPIGPIVGRIVQRLALARGARDAS